MREVVRKTVSRWFYRGKGYATETAALKAKAKDLLKDELYGDRSCFMRPFDHEKDTWVFEDEPPKLMPMSDSEAKAVAVQKLSEKFPHSDTCTSGPSNTACYASDYGEFLRPWCRRAQANWIAEKVEELREATP